MKPVAIFRHAESEGPGYFADYLGGEGIPLKLFRVDAGEPVPASIAEFSGLAFMGGPMSVNDDLPWIGEVLRLIGQAVEDTVPVIGHCLGGQLLARALGAKVSRNAVKEIGWGEVRVEANMEARKWFGERAAFEAFHWHGETFAIPENATRILSSRWCANQAFSLGPHLGMQCHVEMTADMVKAWCEIGRDEIASYPGESVQQPAEIMRDLGPRVSRLNEVASTLYANWIRGLKR